MAIKFRTSVDVQKLVVKEFVKEHNHPINEVCSGDDIQSIFQAYELCLVLYWRLIM